MVLYRVESVGLNLILGIIIWLRFNMVQFFSHVHVGIKPKNSPIIVLYSTTRPGIAHLNLSLPCTVKLVGALKIYQSYNMSRLMGKPTICIGENKDADQLRGNCEADQRLCFRYSDSTIPLLLKSEISSFQLFCVLVQVGLCRT